MNTGNLQRFFLCLIILISYSSAHADTNSALNDNFVAELDPALERRLDDVLDVGFYPRDQQAFQQILQELDENTPIATRIRAESYRILDMALRKDNFELAFSQSEELINLAKAQAPANGQLEALAIRAELFLRSSDTAEALRLVPDIEVLMEQARNPRILFYANHLIGRILRESSQYESALEYLFTAHDVISKTDDLNTQRRRQFVNLHIGRLHSDLENNSAALSLTEQTIKESLEYGLHSRLPDLYLLKGYILGQEGPSQEVLDTYAEATAWAEEVNDDRVRLIGRNNTGSVLILMDRLSEASMVLTEGQQLARELNRALPRAIMEFNLGYIEVRRGNEVEGLAAMEAAVEDIRNYSRDAELAHVLSHLADAYEIAEDYQQQAQTLIEQQSLRNAIFRSERDQAISELQIRYEAEEQKQQILLLEQRGELQTRLLENKQLQQRVVVLFIIVVIMALCLVYIAYRAARKTNQKLNEANEKLQDQSLKDPLTGLQNRRSLQQALTERKRLPGEQDALLLLDIDLFKQINDREGHAAGDAVLVELAARLTKTSRGTDMVIRWGGEEFLIYLRGTNCEALPEFARRVLDIIASEPIIYQQREIKVSATGGFITLPFAGLDETELDWERALQIADMSLYIGKSQGRNQITGVLGINVPYAQVREALASDLAKAISNNWVEITTIKGPPKKAKKS
ncbi:hypothetical protein CWE09_01685 [Aliidiomarina minuta]|uniref:diguanylate cyclase n=1 Tax=Aliidiomarina minuta TaxID=880057 RepID=A0A432W5X5_9GAMM|nr:GGDEF domain-containing protein [Aliidiomarina minuta]RUO25474.1 hypothetical protein CWE09_01685 [Aliidiomarina minuta]